MPFMKPASSVVFSLSELLPDGLSQPLRLPEFPSDFWTMQINLKGKPENGQLLILTKGLEAMNAGLRLHVDVSGNTLSVTIFFDSHAAPLKMEATLEATLDLLDDNPIHHVLLVNAGSKLSLLINNQLADEEWPIGICSLSSAMLFFDADSIADLAFYASSPADATLLAGAVQGHDDKNVTMAEPISKPLQYWKPDEKLRVGDCMPFADQNSFHLFYLQDRHGHQSKWGLGAHQWAHLATNDLHNWVRHPMAIPITEQWEGSICTGSVYCENGIWHAFYALRMSDGSPARITWSISEDGIHFIKSDHYFCLVDPYEPVSARDPLVFKDETGQYHMLVTTSLVTTSLVKTPGQTEEPPLQPGCLAHLISTDLHNWQQREPFLVPGYSDQPECPDLFAINDWYYLIFSHYGAARYRKSRSMFGPWIKPAVDLIDGPAYRVPKTALFHSPDEKIITVGFLAEQAGEYAGCAVFRELYQKPDGDLASRFLETVMPPTQGEPILFPVTPVDGGHGWQSVDFPLTQKHFRLSFVVSPQQPYTNYGLYLDHANTQQGWELRFEPDHGKVGFHRRHERFYVEDEQRSLYGLTDLNRPVQVELICQDRIMDLMINGDRTMVLRLDQPDGGYSRLGFFAMAGAAVFSDIRLSETQIKQDDVPVKPTR